MSEPKLTAVDLDAVAKELPAAHKKLARLIEHFRDVHSVHSDVDMALGMLAAIRPAAKAANEGVSWADAAVTALS